MSICKQAGAGLRRWEAQSRIAHVRIVQSLMALATMIGHLFEVGCRQQAWMSVSIQWCWHAYE